jgi:hypothetical protein
MTSLMERGFGRPDPLSLGLEVAEVGSPGRPERPPHPSHKPSSKSR